MSTQEVENVNFSRGCISELRNENHFNNLQNSDIPDNIVVLLNSIPRKEREGKRESLRIFSYLSGHF